jgi:hypothetical protein
MSTIFDPKVADDLRRRIEDLTPESQPLWGKMNVGQMMCHVTDGFRMSMGERPLPDQSSFLDRTLLKFLVIKVIKMPRSAPTAAGLDQMKEGTPPAAFQEDRKALVDAFDHICSLPADHAWASHPKFGPMTHAEWGILGFKHIDHHLRQFGV